MSSIAPQHPYEPQDPMWRTDLTVLAGVATALLLVWALTTDSVLRLFMWAFLS